MLRLMRGVCLGFTLSWCLGAIAACGGAPETADSTATSAEPTPADTATPPPNSESADPPADALSSEPATPEPTKAQPTNTPVPPLPAECSAPQTQTAMNRCAQAEYEQVDTKLNNTYQTVKAGVSAPREEQLISAEQAWIAFRDTYCDFVQEQFAGGSIQPTVYYGCLTQMTQDRITELQQATPSSLGFAAADQQLNALYQDLQSYLTPAEEELLIDAQLAWIDYRDLHCEFETGDNTACLASVTETRVKHLREQLDTRSL